MKNFMQNGSRMRWKNNGSAAVASGELVPLSGMVGVAATDIPAGAEQAGNVRVKASRAGQQLLLPPFLAQRQDVDGAQRIPQSREKPSRSALRAQSGPRRSPSDTGLDGVGREHAVFDGHGNGQVFMRNAGYDQTFHTEIPIQLYFSEPFGLPRCARLCVFGRRGQIVPQTQCPKPEFGGPVRRRSFGAFDLTGKAGIIDAPFKL